MTGKRKIILYNPHAVFFTMPLGLMAVGSNLDPEKYEVIIVDARLEADALTALLHDLDDALLLGVTILTGAPLQDALKTIRAVKKQYPDLPVVCGGWHPSLFPREMLAESGVDYVVQGQGEGTFAELVDCLAEEGPVGNVAGVTYRVDRHPVSTKPRPLTDPESFRPVDYSLIPVERYFHLKGVRQLDYISSIGCHFRCAFCADPFVYQRAWKALSPTRIGEDLEFLWRQYQFTDLNFQDETFFTRKKRIIGLTEEILKRDLHFSWAATMRADQGVRLTDEVFGQCVASGLRRVLIGVESGNPEMLLRIRKDTSLDQIIESAEMCVRHGVAVIFSFIVGFPGESASQIQDTLNFASRLRSMSPKFETPIFYYKPYPGSDLADTAELSIPTTLDEWAEFDYVQGKAGPWVDQATYRLVECYKFYNHLAWGGARPLWLKPLQWLSRLRCHSNYFAFPFEKTVSSRFRRPPRLS